MAAAAEWAAARTLGGRPGTGDPAAAHLDVVLRSTVGNTPLPTVAEVRGDLTSAGFTSIDERRLVPFQPLRAFVAR